MILAEEDARLLARAAAWTGTTNDFAELARSEGLDFATAVLHERIVGVPTNAEFFRAARQPAKIHADLIGVVPGAFHGERWNTGAAGARVLDIARELGCAAKIVPTASFDALEENARVLLDWLAAHRGRRIALISLSKGGAEVRWALSKCAAALEDVSAWVSISGIVQGTPLIAWLRRRPLRWWGVRLWLWWRGHSARALDELRHDSTSAWPALPANLRVVHVFGFPLQRHLAHPWAARGYARLYPLGPNDGGGILLADCTKLPGIICPIWGADHYLMPTWDVLPLLAGIIAATLRK